MTEEHVAREMPDAMALLRAYADLAGGPKAELRRAESPSDLRSIGPYYKLLPGRRPTGGELRMVFVLPYVRHSESGPGLGGALADAGISETRFRRLLEYEAPADMRTLAEIGRAFGIVGNWLEIARTLYYWGPTTKDRVAEDYWVRVSARDRRGAEKEIAND